MIFSPIKFIKIQGCNYCHNIKKIIKITPIFYNLKKKYKINYNNKKKLLKKIKYGSKYNLKKNIIMPSFEKIKKKYLYFFVKWIINFL
ncbi:hypothetical protein NDNC_0670 [Candidatus Nasuia deltocephalinicola]|nr:hypothetical protein NDNC_0670 [Candidatus Nasuia deltocephalinicola]